MQATYLIEGKRSEKFVAKPDPGELPQETNVVSMLSLLREESSTSTEQRKPKTTQQHIV
jgi:hypothetical protein